MTKDSTSSTNSATKPIIALDCDGVLLDSATTVAQIYEKTFGKQLTVVQPKSYHVSLIIFIRKMNFIRQNL
jgi:beta-phosphoglucomutase-like phosphatase (HAD superfamily)